MHGVGSSGAAQMPHGTNIGCRIHARTWLFRSPPSTSLGGSHDTHLQEATHVGFGGGDAYEADDLTNYMVSFLKERHVTNTGTLKDTFMVNEEGLPLKQVKVPGNF
jgi:hypothetical protein